MNIQYVRCIFTTGSIIGTMAIPFVSIHDFQNAKDPFTKFEKGSRLLWFKTFAKNYWKTGVVVTTTIGCTCASHKISSQQIAAMAASIAGAKQLYDKYDSKITEIIGEEKVHEIKKEIGKEKAKESYSLETKKEHADGELFFYEPVSDQFFYSTIERILKAQNKINYRLIHAPNDYECKTQDCTMNGVEFGEWLDLIGADSKIPTFEKKMPFGWFWGDGMANAFWDYNWGFFGGPWINVSFDEITEGEDTYYYIDYGQARPDVLEIGSAYVKELKDAKMRWENEYA